MKTYPPPEAFAKQAQITPELYEQLYSESIEHPEHFWREQGKCIDWMRPYSQIMDYCFDPKNLYIKWYADGTLNASANCLDRHLKHDADRVALFWQGDDVIENRTLTYAQLHEQVCRFANGLKAKGVQKGDRVAIYLPMIPEAIVAMLACARIGAIHMVVFGGFSAQALASRIQDCGAKVLVTANEGYRRGKPIAFKERADLAAKTSPLQTMIVVQRTPNEVPWNPDRDVWYHDLVDAAAGQCQPEELTAEHPLFILYTSGSTGKPKGVLHTTGGYMVYTNLTFRTIFDYQSEDIYFCTADIGWITGHSYGVYGPLSAGATILMYEGTPDYPTVSRYWQLIEQYKITTFYTAPTAIRGLMRYGDAPVRKYNLDSLRLLGTVGEPIDAKSWTWYHAVIGQGRCPIVDTWWQTETGGILLSPLPGAHTLKPGSVSRPFFGIKPALVNDAGEILDGAAQGNLVITNSWPGQMRTVYQNHDRFAATYFTQCPGMFFTDDQARRDKDGDYWMTGRIDDVIKVSGHRLGTASIESAAIAHTKVAEAAVVGYPHPIKGQGLYLFVTLQAGAQASDDLKHHLIQWIRDKIGPVATPDFIQWVQGLPKTRSGKIMRRILRHIAANDIEDLGDTSTLADPSVVKAIIEGRLNQ